MRVLARVLPPRFIDDMIPSMGTERPSPSTGRGVGGEGFYERFCLTAKGPPPQPSPCAQGEGDERLPSPGTGEGLGEGVFDGAR